MNAGVALALAGRSLMRHRVRTALAMLGIVIGIAAVICMVALGQGASGMVQAQLDAMGRNLLMILPGAAASSGGFSFGGGTGVELTPADADALLEQVPLLVAVTPVERTRGQQLVFGNRNWVPGQVYGVGHTFPQVRSWPAEEGEFFSERDVVAGARVCLLGGTVAERLFEGESPLGKTLRIKNLPFRVVGVLSPKGTSSMGTDLDDSLVMPWTTCLNVIEGSAFDNVDQVLAATARPEDIPQAVAEITEVLRARHRLAPGEPDDFSVRPMAEMAAGGVETAKTMSALLAGIASISLLVGGIGIMNIMLVSVTERTREIGLRLAVGARGRDILQQFLVEAVLLTGAAGVLGLLVGAGASRLLAQANGWPLLLSPALMGGTALFSCAVGVFFGLYPALRAARLDPIEALRHE
ncbi:MAG: ABC transporter permease [Planctomycetes bacterium]|nr:ABC transporter permease [Planctomycetota bacterium]